MLYRGCTACAPAFVGCAVLVVGRYFYRNNNIGINNNISHDAGLFTFFDALGTSDTSAYVGSRLTAIA